jgi:hypothetical protein
MVLWREDDTKEPSRPQMIVHDGGTRGGGDGRGEVDGVMVQMNHRCGAGREMAACIHVCKCPHSSVDPSVPRTLRILFGSKSPPYQHQIHHLMDKRGKEIDHVQLSG